MKTKNEQNPNSQWLEYLLKAHFFKKCRYHQDNKYTCFCTHCKDEPFCEDCMEDYDNLHATHDVIKVCITSEHVAVKTINLGNLSLAITDIQSYWVKSEAILFLYEKTQKNWEKISVNDQESNNCKVCRRLLAKDFKYCSIECKVRSGSKDLESKIICQARPSICGLRKRK